jgi:two-component system, OmpR family, sensor histidine kinase KdpD
VFDKFYRVLHGQHPGGYPMGSGLGLAVCKGLVEAHGGRIWAELRDGGGLIVFVVLPLGEREYASHPSNAASMSGKAQDG